MFTNELEAAATQDPKRRRFSAAFKIAVYNELTRGGEDNPYSYGDHLLRRDAIDAWASLVGGVKAIKEVSANTASGIIVILLISSHAADVSAAPLSSSRPHQQQHLHSRDILLCTVDLCASMLGKDLTTRNLRYSGLSGDVSLLRLVYAATVRIK